MLGGLVSYGPQAEVMASATVQMLRLLHVTRESYSSWLTEDPAGETADLWVGFLAPATALSLWAAGGRQPLLSEETLRFVLEALGQ